MSIVDVFLQTACYQYLWNDKQRAAFQKRELKKLVRYAKAHSPKLAQLYQNIGEDFELTDLPVTTKQMLMDNYDRWVTDPRIKKEQVKAWLGDHHNIGKPFVDGNLVTTTSGSTGHPLYFILNRKSTNVSTSSALLSGALRKKPVCLMYPLKQFLLPTSMIIDNFRRFPLFMKGRYFLVDAMMPLDQMVKVLNEKQPKTMYSYASMMELLADEQSSGRLQLHLEEIICGSEKLTDKTRAYLEEVFHCPAKSIYGSSESGNVGFECRCYHHHLNNPYCIMEPVDEENRPVAPGQHAAKILVTNLANPMLPIIRYEVTDQVVLHTEPCPCGNRNPWIEVEGRTTNHVLKFSNGVRIVPVVLYIMIETMDSFRRFQIILHEGDRLEFRAVFMPGADEQAAFAGAKERILTYLKENGVDNATMYLSDQAPCVDPVTYKFRSVYQE